MKVQRFARGERYAENWHDHRLVCVDVPRDKREASEASEFHELVAALRCTAFRRHLSTAERKRLRKSRRA